MAIVIKTYFLQKNLLTINPKIFENNQKRYMKMSFIKN